MRKWPWKKKFWLSSGISAILCYWIALLCEPTIKRIAHYYRDMELEKTFGEDMYSMTTQDFNGFYIAIVLLAILAISVFLIHVIINLILYKKRGKYIYNPYLCGICLGLCSLCILATIYPPFIM